jgi:hypothetical protein
MWAGATSHSGMTANPTSFVADCCPYKELSPIFGDGLIGQAAVAG